jgi:hypothetical protein
MGGFIALYMTACLNLGNPGSCVTEFVTDSTQNQMTMTECLGVEGLYSAKEFAEKHPLYHTWQFEGWRCQIGNKPAPEKGAGMNLSVARMDQHKGGAIVRRNGQRHRHYQRRLERSLNGRLS